MINSNLITSKSKSNIQLNNKNILEEKNKENNFLTTSNKKRNKQIDNISNNNSINYVDFEINIFEYEEAKNKDKRNYFQYYLSLIKTKHILFFHFLIQTIIIQ